MALNDTALNVMGDALAAVALRGVLENAGATVSDVPQDLTWSASAAGSVSLSAAENFTGPGGQAVDAVGLYSADDLTYYGSVPIPADGSNDLAFNAAGEYTLNDLTLNGSAT